MIAGYREGSKTDIVVHNKGSGGIKECSASLPQGKPVFGGCRLKTNRFVTFFYADERVPVMQKGRAAMHKNGVLNTLVGSDCEIDMHEGLTEESVKLAVTSDPAMSKPLSGSLRSDFKIKPFSAKEEGKPKVQFKATAQKAANRVEQSNDSKKKTFSANEEGKPKVPKAKAQKAANHVEQSNDRIENEDNGTFFPYSILKDKVHQSELPSGVDPSKREQYLSQDEFFDVFGMEKVVFNMLPGWKRKNLKRAKGLF